MNTPSQPSWQGRPASADFYIRLRSDVFDRVLLEHVDTERSTDVLQDARDELGRTVETAGTTEWVGRHEGRTVTIAWDWARDENGCVRVVSAVRPRTNVCLIDHQGYDLSPIESAAELLGLLACRQWQSEVLRALDGELAPTIQTFVVSA